MQLNFETYTEVTTTTVDTLMQAKRCRILVTTIDPSTPGFDEQGQTVELTDHTQLRGLFVVPAGLTVWAKGVNSNKPDTLPSISFIPFGV